MSLNNDIDNRNHVEAKAAAFSHNPWLMLYFLIVVTVFVTGSMVASKSSRKIEIAPIEIAIADQNIQQAAITAPADNKSGVLLAAVAPVPAVNIAAPAPVPSVISVASAGSIASGSTKAIDAKVIEKNPHVMVVASVAKPLVVTIRAKDNLGKIFKRIGLSPKSAAEILALKQAKALKDLHAGSKINLVVDSSIKSGVKELVYGINELDTIIVTSANNKWQVQNKHIKPVNVTKYASATVGSSLYASAKKAGVPQKLIARFVSVMGERAGKIRSGDRFALFYEERTAQGKKIGESDILAAELVRGGKAQRVIGFAHDGHTDFYTPEGHSLKSSFVRSPMEKIDRIGSRFSPARVHPILHITRPHLGVDLVAATGTPVKATSNGRVEYRGYRGGYGRTVIIRNGTYSTLYAHLSRFPADLQTGAYVRQGRVIGYVGSSGLATAPHLHYEFRNNGVHYDPLSVKLPAGEMIAAEHRTRFFAQSRRMVAQFDLYRKEQGKMYALSDNCGIEALR